MSHVPTDDLLLELLSHYDLFVRTDRGRVAECHVLLQLFGM